MKVTPQLTTKQIEDGVRALNTVIFRVIAAFSFWGGMLGMCEWSGHGAKDTSTEPWESLFCFCVSALLWTLAEGRKGS